MDVMNLSKIFQNVTKYFINGNTVFLPRDQYEMLLSISGKEGAYLPQIRRYLVNENDHLIPEL